jgi:hypothetical protein
MIFWFVYSDTLVVAREDSSVLGAIAAGWTGVVAIFAVGVLYTSFHDFASVTYLYWYISGMVCARRVMLDSGHAEDELAGRAPAAQ